MARLVRRRRWFRRGAAPVWLCAAAVVLAGCGHSAGAKPGASGTGGSRLTFGAWRAESSGTRQPLYAVACLSALRCEAVGAAGTILSTVDGGTTWQAQANPLQGSTKILYRIACVPPGSCYVIARPDTILVTHDGGATWSSHVLSLAGVGANLTDQACLSGNEPSLRGPALCRLGLLDIACVSARICSAVATAPPAYGSLPSSAHAATPPSSVWTTSDAGASWARQPVPPGVTCTEGDCTATLSPYPLVWISCLGSGLCRAGGGYFGGCGHCGYVYAVIAAVRPGAPWTMLTCPSPSPGGGRIRACWRALLALHPFPRGMPFSPDDADCPTSDRCYGVYTTSPFDPGNGVYWSADRGELWLGGPSGSRSARNDVACPAALTCYTVGDQGTITRTANGTAFVPDGRPTSRSLQGITCVDAAICYAVGDNGTILARK